MVLTRRVKNLDPALVTVSTYCWRWPMTSSILLLNRPCNGIDDQSSLLDKYSKDLYPFHSLTNDLIPLFLLQFHTQKLWQNKIKQQQKNSTIIHEIRHVPNVYHSWLQRILSHFTRIFWIIKVFIKKAFQPFIKAWINYHSACVHFLKNAVCKLIALVICHTYQKHLFKSCSLIYLDLSESASNYSISLFRCQSKKSIWLAASIFLSQKSD